MKGLILEGGAMRGMFTAGVIDVMMEQGIEYDGLIGVSAGAAFGCNYKSKQIGRAIRYNKRFCRDWRYCSIRSLVRTGDLYGGDFCYRELPERLDVFDHETFNANPLKFYAVSTNVDTGQPFYYLCEDGRDCLPYLRGSASMPLVSRVVEIDGLRLLDGGIADPVPLTFFEQQGYDKNVIVLTQPKEYRKRKEPLLPLMKVALKQYPNILEVMEKRHEKYNKVIEEICRKEERGEVFVIRPPQKLKVGRIEHNPDKLQKAYDMGRSTMLSRIEELKCYLS